MKKKFWENWVIGGGLEKLPLKTGELFQLIQFAGHDFLSEIKKKRNYFFGYIGYWGRLAKTPFYFGELFKENLAPGAFLGNKS